MGLASRLLGIAAVTGLALGSPLATGAASASPPSQNCVFELVPVNPIQTSGEIQAIPVETGCYDTYSQAVAAGSAQGSALGASGPATLAPDVLIGTEWLGLNFNGNSNSYFATETCSSTVSWSVSYVGDLWNDRFSSGKGFGGCDTNKKFEDSNFGGAVLTCTPNCTDYGSLSNLVSSLKWKP